MIIDHFLQNNFNLFEAKSRSYVKVRLRALDSNLNLFEYVILIFLLDHIFAYIKWRLR